MLQPAVNGLMELGSLPSSDDAEVSTLKRFENLLDAVETPISDDDARALATLFGPDDCFGLAWSLIHLIETAPNWPLADVLAGRGAFRIDHLTQAVQNVRTSASGGHWIDYLGERAERGRALSEDTG